MRYQLLPRDASSPIPRPITTKPSSTSHRRGFLTFFGTAAITGILFHILLLGLGLVENNGHAISPPVGGWWDDKCSPLNESLNLGSSSYIRPGLGHYVVADEDEWTLDRVRKMVEGTNGYYARDYSLALGWNNVSPM